jgi:hypothetical protein
MVVATDYPKRQARCGLTTGVPYQGSCRLWAPNWQAASVRALSLTDWVSNNHPVFWGTVVFLTCKLLITSSAKVPNRFGLAR